MKYGPQSTQERVTAQKGKKKALCRERCGNVKTEKTQYNGSSLSQYVDAILLTSSKSLGVTSIRTQDNKYSGVSLN